MKRILLIVNKNWETEPILNALLNYRIRPYQLPNPDILSYPWNFPSGTVKPRAVWNSFIGITIELWCVQDIMDPKWNTSSSQGKNTDLPQIIRYRSEIPHLVIALGTAGFGSQIENNIGCVIIGSDIFIHNFHPNGQNPNSVWDDPVNFEKLLSSTINPSFFTLIDDATSKLIGSRLLKPFLNPSYDIQVLNEKCYQYLPPIQCRAFYREL